MSIQCAGCVPGALQEQLEHFPQECWHQTSGILQLSSIKWKLERTQREIKGDAGDEANRDKQQGNGGEQCALKRILSLNNSSST